MSEFVPNISDAIKALGIDGGFKIKGDKIAKWYSGKEQPTEEAIQAKLTELQAEYDAKQYQRDRQYPDLGEQFDLLFKDINEGTLDKTGGFYTAIKAVKDAHPKPSE